MDDSSGRPTVGSATCAVVINGQATTVAAGTTILKAAAAIGIEIPTLCYHPNLTPNAVCRLCVVEPARGRTLIPACVGPCVEGLEVHTDSERVLRARKVILELLHAAADCSQSPQIAELSARAGADPARFDDGPRRQTPIADDNPFFVRDYSQCILCWRCVQVCADDVQNTFALTLGQRGFQTHIATFFDAPLPETTCVFCGNCVEVCPTGALKGRQEWLLEQGLTLAEVLAQSGRRRNRDRVTLAV